MPISGTLLGVGDFDGDHRADLLVSGDNSYTLSFVNRTPGELRPVPRSADIFAIADLNNDQRSDYVTDVVDRAPALAVFFASPGGELEPAPNPLPVPVASAYRMFAVKGGSRDALLYLAAGREVYQFPDYARIGEQVGLVKKFDLGALVVDLGDDDDVPPIAEPWLSAPILAHRFMRPERLQQLFPDANQVYCEQIVLGINPPTVSPTENQVPEAVIYSPCHLREIGRLKLPVIDDEQRHIQRLMIGDVQGDGLEDLLIVTLNNRELFSDGPSTVFAAYAVADGSFHSKPDVPPEKGDGLISPEPLSFARNVIATGRLNGDVVTDFVTSGTVLFSGSNRLDAADACGAPLGWDCTMWCPLPECEWFAGAWLQVGDFTADGVADMIAPKGSTKDLAFWMGTRDGLFRAFEIPTQDKTTQAMSVNDGFSKAASADFDGDQVLDLAFTEWEVDSRENPQASATILFGKALGAPEQSFRTGGLGSVLQIAAAPIVTRQGPSATLGVLSMYGAEPRATVYLGQANRRAIAPVLVRRSDDAYVSLQVVAGKFRSKDITDLALIDAQNQGEHDQRQIRAVLRDGPGYRMPLETRNTDSGDALLASQHTLFPPEFPFAYWNTFVLDTDGDDIDEIVLWGVTTGLRHVGVMLGRMVNELWQFEPPKILAGDSSDAPLYRLARTAQNVDIDGDGHGDIYGVAIIDEVPVLAMYLSSRNNGNLLSDESLVTIPVPSVAQVHTWLNVDADSQPEFVLFVSNQIQIYDVDLEQRTLALLHEGGQLSGPTTAIAPITSDFDGDGVTDLAYIYSDSDEDEFPIGRNVEILWGDPRQ